jgi:type II secretory pathway component PulM
MNNIREWYLSQTPRDQKLALLLGVLLIAALLYGAVYKPLSDSLETARSRVEGQRAALVWMQEAAAEARSLGAGSGAASRASNKAPYLLVDEAIRRSGLGSPERIEPAGQTGARLQFEAVDFDKLLPMLGQLQQGQGLSVTSANLNRRDTGRVSARLSLESAQ